MVKCCPVCIVDCNEALLQRIDRLAKSNWFRYFLTTAETCERVTHATRWYQWPEFSFYFLKCLQSLWWCDGTARGTTFCFNRTAFLLRFIPGFSLFGVLCLPLFLGSAAGEGVVLSGPRERVYCEDHRHAFWDMLSWQHFLVLVRHTWICFVFRNSSITWIFWITFLFLVITACGNWVRFRDASLLPWASAVVRWPGHFLLAALRRDCDWYY